MNKIKKIMATVIITATLFLTGCGFIVDKLVQECNPFWH